MRWLVMVVAAAGSLVTLTEAGGASHLGGACFVTGHGGSMLRGSQWLNNKISHHQRQESCLRPIPRLAAFRMTKTSDGDEEGVSEEKKGKGKEEASGKKSTLQQMIEGALMSAMKQGESPFTNEDDASTKSKSGDTSSDIVVSQGPAMADLVEDELERARQSLAKNAVRVIELEEQRKRMARPKEISEESEESEEDDDDGEMSDSEELAFQMGFNSIEYVTGSGTVTVTRNGTQTTLIVNQDKDEDDNWIKQLASFLKSPKKKKAADKEAPKKEPPSPQKPKAKEATERFYNVGRVWRAWYGRPSPGSTLGGKFPPAAGRVVTAQVNANLRVDNGEKYLLVKRPLNKEFGDPFFGVSKVLVIDYIDSKGVNRTATFEEKVVVPEGGEFGDAEDQRSKDSVQGGLADEGMDLGGEAGDDGPFGGESWWNKIPWYNGSQSIAMEGDGGGGGIKKGSKVIEARHQKEERKGSSDDSKSSSSSSGAGEKKKTSKTERKPPPVIPYLKYASIGPPQSEWTKEDCSKPAFRILSLDGGGVRGALTTVLLQRIIDEVPSFLDEVDLIAGTSTGGLIGLMLAAGYSPAECQDIYEYGCPKIFSKDKWRVYNPTNAKYTAQGREELCRTYLGDERTLKDLNKHVVITAFRLDGKVGNMGAFISRNGGWRPAVFSNIPKLKGDLEPDLNLYAWDAALRTSAAPTYFPVHRGYVDGAMFQNNPSMLAVTKACAHFPKVSPENCVVLSIGAGNFPMSIPQAAVQDLDWGIKDWVPYIFDLMMDGDSLSSEVLMRYMLGDRPGTGGKRYHRIDPQIDKYVDLDDVEVIPELIELGKRVDLNDTIRFVQQHFSSTPSASDAFAQAAQRTAGITSQLAAKVQLSDVVRSLTAAPQAVNYPWMGTSILPNMPDLPDFPGFPRSSSSSPSSSSSSKDASAVADALQEVSRDASAHGPGQSSNGEPDQEVAGDRSSPDAKARNKGQKEGESGTGKSE